MKGDRDTFNNLNPDRTQESGGFPGFGIAETQDFSPRSADEIVRLLQQGIDPQENFRELFRRYYRRVYAFFARRGFPPHQCDDLTQETFLRVHQLSKTCGEEIKFEDWLFITTVNVYRDSTRAGSESHRPSSEVLLGRMAARERGEARRSAPLLGGQDPYPDLVKREEG